MHVRHLLPVTTAAALVDGFGLASPAVAHASADPAAAAVFAMSSGRLGAAAAGLLGLTGVIIGGFALVRPASRIGTGRLRSVVALAAGLLAMAIGGLVVATSDSGIGTGNGRGGAYVALVLGLLAVGVGGLGLARSGRLSA